jgi:hypothetical protein
MFLRSARGDTLLYASCPVIKSGGNTCCTMYSRGFEEGGVKDGEIEEGQIGSCIIELNDYCCNRSCNTFADF